MARLSEEELVRAAIAGDKAAYGTLYDRFAPIARAVCHDYTHNLAAAQDLAQDVFLRAYQRLGELRKTICFTVSKDDKVITVWADPAKRLRTSTSLNPRRRFSWKKSMTLCWGPSM